MDRSVLVGTPRPRLGLSPVSDVTASAARDLALGGGMGAWRDWSGDVRMRIPGVPRRASRVSSALAPKCAGSVMVPHSKCEMKQFELTAISRTDSSAQTSSAWFYCGY